jgi:hypothetical protein
MVIKVDGHVVARLRQGQCTIISVEQGRHEIQARIDWLRSLPVILHSENGTEAIIEFRAPSSPSSMFVKPKEAIKGIRIR